MLGNLGPDYEDERTKALKAEQAAAEAAALANINPDGGHYNEVQIRPLRPGQTVTSTIPDAEVRQFQLNMYNKHTETLRREGVRLDGGPSPLEQFVGDPGGSTLTVLEKIGDTMDAIDKAAGIPGTPVNVYNARHALIDPATSLASKVNPHFGTAVNIAGEMFIPDSTDIASGGIGYLAGIVKGTGDLTKLAGKMAKNKWPVIDAGTLGLTEVNVKDLKRVLSTGQQRLLTHLTPENIAEISDPGLRTLYEKAAKMLNTPGLSKRNAEVLLQTGPDSKLIELLEGVDDPVLIDKVVNSYFTRNVQYFSGGFNFNLDHLVPVSSTAKLASKVKPSVFQEALALQFKRFGRRFGHDQEFSLIPRRTHAAKHTGSTQAILEGKPPDWKTKYLDKIIDDLPENASVEQVSEALSKMYDKSLQETGKALSDKDFFSIREGVMDSLPRDVYIALGENFDITGRMSSVEDPLKWKLFLAHLRGAPSEVKTILQKLSQVQPTKLNELDLLRSNKYNPYR